MLLVAMVENIYIIEEGSEVGRGLETFINILSPGT